jgi:hypothetical protein
MIGNLLAPFRLIPDLLIRFIEDDGLAYIGLMSLLLFLVFVFTLLGLVGQADQGAGIIDLMFRFMPAEVALTLQEPVVQVVGRASGGVLTLSIIVVLWITASGVEGTRSALNRAYRTRETRGYWRRRANSSSLVVVFAGLIVIAIGCMLVGPLLWNTAAAPGPCLFLRRRCTVFCPIGSRHGSALSPALLPCSFWWPVRPAFTRFISSGLHNTRRFRVASAL